MKKYLLVAAVAVSALFAGSAAMAQDSGSLSYNLAVTSNYVWRGVSQTNGKEALQGGVDYKKGSFYAGAWASNVDFDAPKLGQHANTEIDLYAGIAPTMGDWSFDFGGLIYAYPSADSSNFAELKAAVSHPMGNGTIGTALYVNSDEMEDPYYEVNASYPLSDKFSVSGALGNYEAFGYTTFNAGVTYAFTDALSVDVRYSQASKGLHDSCASCSLDNTFVTLKAGF